MKKNLLLLGIAGLGLYFLLQSKKVQAQDITPQVLTNASTENVPFQAGYTIDQIAQAQGMTAGELYRSATEIATEKVIQEMTFGNDRSLRTGAGKGVLLEVTKPSAREGEVSGIKIVNPVTGKLEDSRQVFLQSFKPTGLTMTTSPAGTLSAQPTNVGGAIRRSSLSGSVY